MIVAYLRVSTGKQFLSNQQEEIRRYAESRNWTIDQWVTEVASGSRKGSDRKLGALLQQMKRGDTLIVTEVSRLSRTLTEIMAIMGLCLKKGIKLYTIKEGYSFDNSINSKVLCFAATSSPCAPAKHWPCARRKASSWDGEKAATPSETYWRTTWRKWSRC